MCSCLWFIYIYIYIYVHPYIYTHIYIYIHMYIYRFAGTHTLKALVSTEMITVMLQRDRVDARWLCNSVQLLLFCSSERSIMARGRDGKVISRASALRPARGRGLCASACTPMWSLWVRSRHKATHNIGVWLAAWEKQTHTRYDQKHCAYWHAAPRDGGRSARQRQDWEATWIQISTLHALIRVLYSDDLMKLTLRRVRFIGHGPRERCTGCLNPATSCVARQPKPPQTTPRVFDGATWCNTEVGASDAKGYTANGSRSKTAGKSFQHYWRVWFKPLNSEFFF